MTVRPNPHTFALAAMTLAMWYAGEAQKNGGAYILAFLAGTLTLVSWLHARANLRGLRLEVGTVPTATQGGSVSLPLLLSAGDGPLPCGLEITAVGAHEPAFVDTLTQGHPAQVSLRMPAGSSGKHTTHTVLVRSRYPLGFFTALRIFHLPSPYLVHPRPAGDLPLPNIDERQHAAIGTASAASERGATGAGDDFAGVREWQAGDSLRQVDWKAVARGRPMMVKLWTGESKGDVWLDWAACPAPVEARAAQFAAWMEQAETLGLNYGLRLPSVVIQPAQGLAHKRRCLDELALLQQEIHSSPRSHHPQAHPSLTPTSAPTLEFSARIPGKPTRLLLLGMALAGLPMLGGVPWAGPVAYYLSLLLYGWRQRRGLAPLGQLWRLLTIAAGVSGVWIQSGTLYGIEAGIAIMLIVTGAKLLETRNAHDLQIAALLGWFLCLCALTLDQALARSLYVLGVFALITTALVRLRRGRPGIKAPARMAAVLFAQAAPLVLMLFLFFPRGSGGLVMHLARQLSHRTGISSTMDPGSVAEIAQLPGRAFWVAFPEGPPPEISDRYWRCVVMWNCEGFKWKRGTRPMVSQPFVPSIKKGTPTPVWPPPPPPPREVRQVITLEPHGSKWLAALDFPVHVMSNIGEHSFVQTDSILESQSTVDSVRRYEVGSLPRPSVPAPPSTPLGAPPVLSESERDIGTTITGSLSPAVRQLAASFKQGRKTSREIAAAGLDYFRNQGFRYTLTPDTYGADGLDDFLFRRKLGFCEHFAASFATLMRQCGVPARIVIGYLGGEYSERWGHYTVHQADAHAWCELWYEGKGWTRVDPTAELAPGRIGVDLRTYLEGGPDSAFARNRNTWWGRAITETQLFWDQVNYQWYTRVVQFDEDDQSGLIAAWKLLRYGWKNLVIALVVCFLLPLALLWWWLSRTPRHADPAVRAWQAFCKKLARHGVKPQPAEPPATYTARAAKALPQAATQINHIGGLYVQVRYADNHSVIRDLKRSVAALRVR